MSRWIDADAMTADLLTVNPQYESQINWALQVLHAQPSIDLVRCAECKFKSLYDDGETKYYYCALEDRPNRQWSVDDWNFCYWGERKENK